MAKKLYVGIKGIIYDNETHKILVLKKDATDLGTHWDVPGGKIEDHETIEETLTREIREEVPSIEQFQTEHILSAHHTTRMYPDDIGLVVIFYLVSTNSFEVTLSDEHFEFNWISRKDFEDSDVYIPGGIKKALTAAFDYLESER